MTARRDLAARQAALLGALLAGGQAPAGFDDERLAVEATALRGKRRKVVAYLDPELAEELGDRFAELFDAYALAVPPVPETGARADTDRFADWLVDRGELRRPRRFPHRARRRRRAR